MKGLLDFISTPEGQGLLAAGFGGLAGARRGQPINSLGRAGLAGLAGYSGAQDRIDRQDENAVQKQFRDMQMQGMQAQMAKQKGEQEWLAGLGAVMQPKPQEIDQFTGTTQMQAPDPQALQNYAMQPNSPFANDILKQRLFPKEQEAFSLTPGGVRFDGSGKVIAQLAEKPEKIDPNKPFMMVDGKIVPNPEFQKYDMGRARAGASSVNVNTDNLGLKPKDRFEMEGKLRADYEKATTTDSEMVSIASNISNLLDQKGALKDQAAIYTFAKALDPMGAVREADYAAIVRTAGGLDYVTSLVNKAITGEQLSPKQRTEMRSLTKSMAKVAGDRIKKQQGTFANRASMYNLKPENVFNPQGETGVVDFGSLK